MEIIADAGRITEPTSHAERAVELKRRIDAAEAEVAKLKEDCREEIRLALVEGVQEYDGYRFSRRAASKSIDEAAFLRAYPDLYDGFTAWIRDNVPVKMSLTGLQRYLGILEDRGIVESADDILRDVSVVGDGETTYCLIRKTQEAVRGCTARRKPSREL